MEAAGPVDRRLLDAIVGVAEGLDLEPTLRRIIRAAAELTGARYAAIGVLGENGLQQTFVQTGTDTRPTPSVLDVPVGIGGRAVGNLHLTGKDGGFSAADEDVVVALAAAAAVAVDNANLYAAARRREGWLSAAQRVGTAMLRGADDEDALELIAASARSVAGADVSVLVLPNLGGEWLVEVADGALGQDLVGTVMPEQGRTLSVVRTGEGLRLADLGHEPVMLVPALRRFGPALYAPLVAGDETLGVLLLLRRRGAEPFAPDDLTTAETFAGQAALALQLAEGRRLAADAELLEDRHRIARDLHDLVMQELFAMGMRLGRLRAGAGPEVAENIDSSLESLDRVVGQIRATIRSLRDPGAPAGLLERLHGEAVRARSALGFEPELVLEADGDPDELLGSDVADDLVAVVREGLSNAARHARPGKVRIDVAIGRNAVRAEVADDGLGLPPEASRRSGLGNLAERAQRHGGRCEATARDGGGTVLRWTVPLGDTDG